ncbi:MAG: hypothetical protein HY834_02870 [Devosia nanyangense]|uniref:Uncharacterized protein n=1 Tax=Devosia nanyangense TaxID=1228055 RepID=A0A933L163_9HYPH|nr:hypothetical protein [Devosia nanyangense]
MSSARYFVFSRGDTWIVALDGVPLGHHSSRPAALSSAIVMADLMGSMRYDADVMLESEGHLDLAWTYGVDPLPRTEAAA